MKTKSQRGRQAGTPNEITLLGWWDIAKRLVRAIGEQNMSILAAGVAFYSMLAIFPAMGAIVTIYALVADPQLVSQHLSAAGSFLPADVLKILDNQLLALTSRPTGGLSWNLLIGILFAVWSAHRGVDALVAAIGVAYHEPESRGLIKLNILTYTLTLAAVLFIVIILILMIIIPSITSLFPVPSWWDYVMPIVRWVLFLAIVSVAVATLYRFAPARRAAQWVWLSPGAVIATLLWLLGSAGFSFYVTQFGTYNETYGTLGAIIVLLLWFFISSYSILIGAAINAEMEHQTKTDTTKGPDRPFGERDAVVADTVADIP